MSLPKSCVPLFLGAASLIAGVMGSASATAAAAGVPAASASPVPEERVCTGPQEIRTDAEGKQMKADVTLCAVTNGRTVWYELSPKCSISNPISTWGDFPGCYMDEKDGIVSKGTNVLTEGTRTSYAGPGTYTFDLWMHVLGHRVEDSGGSTDLWVDGKATYHLDFTKPETTSGVTMTAQVETFGFNGGGGPVALGVLNKGKAVAHNVVLSIADSFGAHTDASEALAAYGAELTRSPRQPSALAAAKKKAQGFAADNDKHTSDPRCLSSKWETFCDMGDIGPGKAAEAVDLEQILRMADWHVSAAEDPEGESGYVPSSH